MYTFDSRVRYSEVGEDARITVSARTASQPEKRKNILPWAKKSQ